MNSETTNPNLTNSAPTQAAEPPKKCKHMPAIIILAVLAVAGIGFGGFELWQNMQRDSKIADLETQIKTNFEENITNNEANESVARKQNPVIMDTETEFQSLSLSSLLVGGEMDYELNLGINNGDISSCSINSVESKWVGGNDGGIVTTKRSDRECKINGITGKIYKAVEIGEGQDSLNNSVAFIMQDGSVEYFSLNDVAEESEFNIVGKMKIDGYVTDAFNIGVGDKNSPGGYVSTIFILADGSYARYDGSMLN